MSITTIPCDLKAKSELTVLVARKYGKTRGVLGEEITRAIREHCKKLEKELQG